jgi:NET1-associated nuclear protein 1 (U3 small nucleolar RNA-associated protein 17)
MILTVYIRFLLLAHSRSLHVYSTKTSLLVRAMDLDGLNDFIKTFKLDPKDENRVYVGTSMSRLLLWDWTCGRLLRSWTLQSLRSIESLASCADEEAQSEGSCGIVYVGGHGSNKLCGLWRFELFKSNLRPIKLPIYEDKDCSVPCVQVFNAGKIVAAAMGRHLLIGNKHPGGSSESTTWGIFRKYPMSFGLTCIDGYLPSGPNPAAGRSNQESGSKLGDIIVGDQNGALHLFHNSLEWREGWSREPVISRLHWHRSGVRSVKFALDGRTFLFHFHTARNFIRKIS